MIMMMIQLKLLAFFDLNTDGLIDRFLVNLDYEYEYDLCHENKVKDENIPSMPFCRHVTTGTSFL